MLSAILKRDSASALDRARADLVAMAEAIAQLGQRREAALTADANIDAVAALDREADEQGRKLRVLQDRIALLEARAASEERDRAAERYRAAVAAIAPRLAARAKAAEGIERWLAGFAGAVKEFMVATEDVLKAWPEDVPFPNVYADHALSLERFGALIQKVFVPSRGHADRRPLQPSEFITRAADADRHPGFAEREKELGEEFLIDLKTAHDPSPVETNSEAA